MTKASEKLHEDLCTSYDQIILMKIKIVCNCVAIELPDRNIKPRKLKGFKRWKGFCL